MTAEEISVIWLTVKTALFSTLLTTPIAIGVGWLLARKQFRFKALYETLITLPLVVPPVVTGYLLLLVLGHNGVIGKYLYQLFGISLSFNYAALVIASLVVSLPLAVRSSRAAFEMVNPAYEKVATTLGDTPLKAFLKVTLPLAWPGILSGIVLSFARSLGEFGATITLAGNIAGKTQTVSLRIYSNMQLPGAEAQVARLVAVSILLSVLAMATAEYLSMRTRKTRA